MIMSSDINEVQNPTHDFMSALLSCEAIKMILVLGNDNTLH